MNRIKVVMVEPGKKAQIKEIGTELPIHFRRLFVSSATMKASMTERFPTER